MPEIVDTNLPQPFDTLWFKYEDGTKEEFPCRGILEVEGPEGTVKGFAVFYGMDPDPVELMRVPMVDMTSHNDIAAMGINVEGTVHSCALCSDI